MAEIILDPCIEGELWDVWQFIARDNPDAASRVIESVRQDFKLLAANPGIGNPRRFRNSRLRDVRSWRVSGFENYLIFYRPLPHGIQVHHVYHAARNIDSLFGS